MEVVAYEWIWSTFLLLRIFAKKSDFGKTTKPFKKSMKELNYSDAALLAALPKAPSKYNPYRFPEVGKFRRNLVLQNMYENDIITKDQFEDLKKSNLNLKKRKIEIVNEANSNTEEVRRSVKEN